MFSVVPGLHDSEVSSDSESDISRSESGADGDQNEVSLNSADNVNPTLHVAYLLHVPSDAEKEHQALPRLDLDTNDVSECMPPAGTSHQNWEKFQSLQKRRSKTKWVTDVTKSSRYKKRRRRKRRKSALHVQGDGQSSRSHCDQTDSKTAKIQSGSKEESQEVLCNSEPSSESSTSSKQQQQEHWGTLKKYLNVNDHLKRIDHGKYAPKSGMEKKLDEAVAAGDFEKAEEISEDLSKRELACKIAKAANARDYLAWKHEQDERREANKKKEKETSLGI
ncbi:protein FAM204A-like [Amphiura filiformis]|uniref:protein FAM204A-like n=1 Tax=Amphiura filiformis TaxID=82378 RepID=UPI003B2143E4